MVYYMKKVYIYFFILLYSCQTGFNSNNNAKLLFNEKEYNFGSLKYQLPYTHTFIVKNAGDLPLIIFNVETSCGCTVPHWSKTPIKPGREGNIEVIFSSTNIGFFRKTITVYYNGNSSPDTLFIKGEVE